MKKFILSFILSIGLLAAQDVHIIGLGHGSSTDLWVQSGTSSTLVIDGSTKKIGAKFHATPGMVTNGVSSIDMYVVVTGSLAGTNWKLRIESDSGSDTPSGSCVPTADCSNGPTAEFTISGTGWVGLKALTQATGALTLNNPYWVVLYYSSGTAPDASNKVSAYLSRDYNRDRTRLYNGTDWTTVSSVQNGTPTVFQLGDSSYEGHPMYQSATVPSVRIYGNQREGLRFQCAVKCTIRGVTASLTKVGTPSDLDVLLYEGDTQKNSVTVPASSIIGSTTRAIIYFSSAVTLAAGSTGRIVFRQNADGGTSANYYAIYYLPVISSSYTSAWLSSTTRFLTWSGGETGKDTPSGYTDQNTWIPVMAPFIKDLDADLSATAGSGTGNGGYVQ